MTEPAETFAGPCLWCGAKDFTSNLSHIVPSAVGNDSQFLKPGLVCRKCNSYFGTELEPALLREPLFHVAATTRRVVNVRRSKEFRDELFDSEHPATDGVVWNIAVSVNVEPMAQTIDVEQRMSGRMRVEYSTHMLGVLSRAIHKIALEYLAWSFFQARVPGELDPWGQRFDAVRTWVREGQPQNSVRPLLRMFGSNPKAEWDCQIWGNGGEVDFQVELFGDWYALSLTAPIDDCREHLLSLTKGSDLTWLLGSAMELVPARSQAQPP